MVFRELLTNVFTSTASYTILGLIVGWVMGEFNEKSFNSSMYWVEYWVSIRIMIVTGIFATFTTQISPYALYSNPFEYGWLYNFESLIFYLFLFDLLNFWAHRIAHTKWLYRNIHCYHHTFRPVMTMSAAAISVGDTLLIGQIPVWVPVILIKLCRHGMWIGAFYGIITLITVYSIYLHSMVGHQIKRGFIVDNADHLKHHFYTQCNYGNLFRFWDKIMGSYRE